MTESLPCNFFRLINKKISIKINHPLIKQLHCFLNQWVKNYFYINCKEKSYSEITSNSSIINVLPAAPLNASPSALEEQTIANLYFFEAS